MKRLTHTLAMVLTAAGLSACEINHLREAQATFNATAQADDEMRLALASPSKDKIVSGADPTLNITSGYASVIVSLNNLAENREQSSSLKKDGLWGIALAMKGLSYWRLGKYDQVDGVYKEAMLLMKDGTLGGRDRALIAALPGLVRNTQAYGMFSAPPPACAAGGTCSDDQQGFIDTVCLLANADDKVAQARKEANPQNPIQVYLIQTQMATVRNLRVALAYYGFAVDNPGGAHGNQALSRAKLRAECAFSELVGLAKASVDGATQATQLWAVVLPYRPDATACAKVPEVPQFCSGAR